MKEWLYRALRTFFQAAVGYLAANLVMVVSNLGSADGDALKVALIGLGTSAVAAGLSALMNMHKKEDTVNEENDNA